MILSIISQGLVWAVLGLGIFMTFRILGFPDMTTEGSFPLGGAVAVTLITKGVNPFLATAAAVLAGCAVGAVTGLLYTKGKIPTLLSGILVMTSCHSIMLMLMGRANLGLLGSSKIQDILPFSGEVNDLLTGLIFVSLVIAALLFFLDTKLGQAYIATGDNPDMARSFGDQYWPYGVDGTDSVKWLDCSGWGADCPAGRLCRCFPWDWSDCCRSGQSYHWRGALPESDLGRASDYHCSWCDCLSVLDLGRYCSRV